MATKEEIQELFNRLSDKIDKNQYESNERYRELSERVENINNSMTQLIINIKERLDDQNVMTNNKFKLFRDESNQIMSDKIREAEERFGFVNNVLEEKVDKNRGQLIDIIDHGYKQAKQRLEEASTDLRASINAIDEKTEAS